jgi:hypothetical protein
MKTDLHFLNTTAHALRLVETDVENNTFVCDDAVTFPDGPYLGCCQTLRQAYVFGEQPNIVSRYSVDILDSNGDIIQEINLSKLQFDALRRALVI